MVSPNHLLATGQATVLKLQAGVISVFEDKNIGAKTHKRDSFVSLILVSTRLPPPVFKPVHFQHCSTKLILPIH